MTQEEKIAQLKPKVAQMAREFIAKCKQAGFDLFIDCTYRSPEEQDILYARGRTTPGSIITNAKGGQSLHQYGVAFDCYPVVGGKIIFDSTYRQTAPIAKACGLEWGGDWTSFPDRPHFQYLAGYALADFQNNRVDWSKFGVVAAVTPPSKEELKKQAIDIINKL